MRSKQSVKSHSKVKRIQMLNKSDEEENDKDFAQISSVGNIQKSVSTDEKCVDKDSVFKRITRRNKLKK